MKNLFEFATKELSQDAFLRWLFENYNCDNKKVRDVAAHFLKEFAEIDANDIQKLETVAQWRNIDVTIWIELKNETKHIIAIEDKAESREHHQLKTYNNHLDYQQEHEQYLVHRIFYKTFEIEGEELDRVNEAGWKKYDLDTIVKELISPFEHTGCEILDCYLSHVKKLHECFSRGTLPDQDKSIYDTYSWYGFFKKIQERYNSQYSVGIKITQYHYVAIWFYPRGIKAGPYLEIRSRDCARDNGNNDFKAYILAYGKDDWEKPNYTKRIKKLCNRIDSLISCKKIACFVNNSRRGDQPKQLVCTSKKDRISNEDEFFTQLDKCLSEYDTIMESFCYADIEN